MNVLLAEFLSVAIYVVELLAVDPIKTPSKRGQPPYKGHNSWFQCARVSTLSQRNVDGAFNFSDAEVRGQSIIMQLEQRPHAFLHQLLRCGHNYYENSLIA